VITNALILDLVGVVKADIGVWPRRPHHARSA